MLALRILLSVGFVALDPGLPAGRQRVSKRPWQDTTALPGGTAAPPFMLVMRCHET